MSELLANLSSAMLLSPVELMRLIRSAPRRYKVYQIRKRAPGQFRTIAQPAKEVKALQRWVMEHVLNRHPVHAAATGYRRGQSIADNARRHVHGHFLLKLDFQDFFPSLKSSDFAFQVHKRDPQLTNQEIEALSRILFWKPRGSDQLCLSIGAPSSPLLSNILLYDFDSSVDAYCSKLKASYTRYADDLSFSADTSAKLQKIEEMVGRLCRRLKTPKLTINTKKTVRVSRKKSRRITGLVITNDESVSLGREQKRCIRASVHYFATGRLSKRECLQLRGMLAYVNSVEPAFLVRLRVHYGAEVIRAIQTFT